jgi:uncharacterized surface protein with fasciclin (FAS1) repeats
MHFKSLTAFIAVLLFCGTNLPAEAKRSIAGYDVETVESYENPVPGVYIGQLLEENERLSSFARAVNNVGLTEELNLQQGFTAFVPVNEAFEDGKIPSDYLSQEDQPVSEFLSMHVVNSRINLGTLRGYNKRFQSLAGNMLNIRKIGRQLYVNGQRILDVERHPSGMIYYVESFVTAPQNLSYNTPFYNGPESSDEAVERLAQLFSE